MLIRNTALALVLGLAVMAGQPEVATAGKVTTTVGPYRFNVGVTSMREARFRKVVRQEYDFSCGSAALATLLSYHYDRPTGEEKIFQQMWAEGDQETIKSRGFSLLDMKNFLESQGLGADGFQAPLDKLQDVGIPAIALINLRGYLHFVVIKGVTKQEVLVGDPAIGVKVYGREDFEKMWNGVVFVITSAAEAGRKHFNLAADWQARQKAPLGYALSRYNLSVTSLMLPRGNEF